MQGNETFSKIIRTKPHSSAKPQHPGKQWSRTDKRAAFTAPAGR